MRNLFTTAAFVGAIATAAILQAAPTLQMEMTSTEVGTSSTFNINIYAQVTGTDTDGTNISSGYGGLSGVQFDVLSEGNGLSNAVHGTGLSATKVPITWGPAVTGQGFTLTTGLYQDGQPAQSSVSADYSTDGDYDEVGAAFSDNSSSATSNQIGVNGFTLLGTIQWTLNPGQTNDKLDLFALAPLYYDVNSPGTNYQDSISQSNIDLSRATGVVIAVPEPASLSLLGLGALGLIARRRRA